MDGATGQWNGDTSDNCKPQRNATINKDSHQITIGRLKSRGIDQPYLIERHLGYVGFRAGTLADIQRTIVVLRQWVAGFRYAPVDNLARASSRDSRRIRLLKHSTDHFQFTMLLTTADALNPPEDAPSSSSKDSAAHLSASGASGVTTRTVGKEGDDPYWVVVVVLIAVVLIITLAASFPYVSK
ncbi:hypothetical protein HPB50_012031 [Hyalomma asiaticum]|uniref:Uncharacterized protein n=1 Tax=Hyalomma asiaticum TaxID=266040 RepID=A0ACB7T2B0_HYAAI|nr:hypothetical protein HPB50_012031 [Hyalomma asiaticum]